MGIFMAGDLLTLFFLYEMMTLTTYILVVHSQNKTAIEAGTEYLFLGILGGFAIFIAMTLIYPITGSFAFTGAHQLMMSEGIRKYLIAGLLLMGFGMKSGMVPLHVWLPKAHPVAPAPASSLLSGIMIKVGVFGLIQSFIYFYLPSDFSLPTPAALGAVLIGLSLLSMVFGAFMAFIQDDMKRLLAYSSISQVGFVILGLGIAMVQGDKGGPGLAGALMHGMNHALFKALLFMVAGMVYLKAHELRMSELGGLRKKMPITAAISIIASLAVMGMPLLNGYASKTILHHALTDTVKYQSPLYIIADVLFILASIGTVAYFLKFNLKVFFGALPKRFEGIKLEARSVYAPMLMMALSLILLGIFPVFSAETLILPYLNTLSFDHAFTTYGVLEVSLFGASELLLIAGIWAGGIIIYVLNTKLHFDEIKLPPWLHLEFLVLFPLSALLHGLLGWVDKDHQVMDPKTFKSYDVRDYKLTFKDHLVAFTDTLNKKYEALFIQSDALIYAIGLTVVVIILGVIAIFN
jgi:formate hydrogenlyase subunit 3/multisubunit Na+/H+ antiporter MnhD subunit